MNTETIGTNAGTVWVALNSAETLGIKQLKKVTKLKDKEVFAALGWLAREGKITIATDPEDEKELLITLVAE
ncbi:MAG: winged helix-turn-helix domain-containing protein [Muribaculaceae bacterium]|nr:winged helix-turn-helix domain-containing protein [Muribaculaceae bacterium]